MSSTPPGRSAHRLGHRYPGIPWCSWVCRSPAWFQSAPIFRCFFGRTARPSADNRCERHGNVRRTWPKPALSHPSICTAHCSGRARPGLGRDCIPNRWAWRPKPRSKSTDCYRASHSLITVRKLRFSKAHSWIFIRFPPITATLTYIEFAWPILTPSSCNSTSTKRL